VTSFFLDTGYVVALESVNDQHHSAAIDHWRRFLKKPTQLFTTSFVMDEAVTYFTSRGRHAKAVEVGTRLMNSSTVRLVHVDEELLRAAFTYLERRPDKRFSLTDCVSFVLMQRLGIQEALTFDVHFEQAGFTRVLPIR
jgi:predicted nucleic acid-binding protein